jgi:23S rRNA (uridine2552-2'-O)-methyltransferase
MNFAYEQIDKKGKFVSKIFMGSSFNEIVADAKKKFKEVNIYKPLSSRKDSKESFIICKFLR